MVNDYNYITGWSGARGGVSEGPAGHTARADTHAQKIWPGDSESSFSLYSLVGVIYRFCFFFVLLS